MDVSFFKNGHEKSVETIKDEKYKKLVSQFIKGCEPGANISITEHEDYFEIIVSHPSTTDPSGKTYSGGAEQYFLDKKTGKTKMGWHEHPMEMPEGF